MRLYEFTEVNEDWKNALGVAGLGLMAANGIQHYNKQPETEPTTTHQAQAQVSKDALNTLALTMWGEARNQGEDGMRAVGHVVKNRAENGDGKFGNGIEGVAKAPRQFSMWNKGDPNSQAIKKVDHLDPTSVDAQRWQEAKMIAANILSGKDEDLTNGALYYHTTAVHPKWSSGVEPSAQIGSHLFYNNIA